MARQAKLGTILENACRLAGRDPSLVAIPAGWKVLAAMAVESGLNALAAEKFPAMQRVELRRFRPPWSGSVRYERLHEVWHDGAYWRLDDENAQGRPGVADGWRRLQPGDLARFIAFDQPWEEVAIQSADPRRFAYAADPRYHPGAAPVCGCAMGELGVMLPSSAPDEVYVRFVPEFPRFDYADWSAESVYSPGDTAYVADTRDVWRLVAEEAPENVSPDASEGAWRPLRVPGEAAAYLTRLAAADLMTEDQGKFQTRAAADREFEALLERWHDGAGETRVRTGRFR